MGGLTSLLLLLCVGVTVSTVLDLQKRIVGGRDCLDYERRYHVKLIINNGSRDFLCGGSLISTSWILTAGHCWQQGWTISAEVGVHPDGGQPAVPIREENVEVFDTDHDIMLLRLTNPAPINHTIPLPNCAPGLRPPLRDIVQVAGYGPRVAGANTPSPNLQCVDLTKVGCPWTEIRTNNPEPDRYMFCGKTDGVTTRTGDSGGGVEYNGRIYGVHSSTFTRASGPISLITDVCKYMVWIQRITGIQ